jgi:hypothetical protein
MRKYFIHKHLVNKRGMALFVVFSILLFLSTLAIHVTRSNLDTYRLSKISRESERADFMARGAIQIALLKLSVFPYEFVDAINWKKNNVYSDDWREGIPGIPTSFSSEDLTNAGYYDKYVGCTWNPTTKTRLSDPTHPDLQWSIVADPAQVGSFDGSGYINFINLVSRQDPTTLHWVNSVEIQAHGEEISEMGSTDARLGTHQKNITEMYRFSRVHVEGP